jgi:hypothetical protein
MDIDTIETQIFGGRMGRMKWTAAASPLSRHHRNEHGECIPDDPTSDPAVAAIVEQAKTAGPGQQRVFTLVDTGLYLLVDVDYKYFTKTTIRKYDCDSIPRRASTCLLLDG